jgi:hypothetical protein
MYVFYAAELERAGWVMNSNLVSEASARLVARYGPHGITISINDTGTGTAVSIGGYGGGRSMLEDKPWSRSGITNRPEGSVGVSGGQAASGPVLASARLETFSDGVFAIAITLLVLDLTISAAGGTTDEVQPGAPPRRRLPPVSQPDCSPSSSAIPRPSGWRRCSMGSGCC